MRPTLQRKAKTMFKENQVHKQLAWISNVNDLPEKQRKRLEESWAGVFYREFFCRIDEHAFAVLYADIPSRPNVPVNVLVGLEALKAGFGWSDQELEDAFIFDVQVRYALGYQQLGEGEFDVRTIYNFRRRVVKHLEKTGENLIAKAFEQVTDEQVKAYQLKTGKLRMDSTQIASSICDTTRLRLLVEVLQRTHRMLDETDQERYAKAFAPYLKGKAGQYAYRVKPGESGAHLERIGLLMHQLVEELANKYGDEHSYSILKRVFAEHYVMETESGLRPKEGQELSASSLQSPDDEQASYRQKRGEDYVGYAANITETCDPENDLQLVMKVQVEPNTTEDAQMLEEALPELKERTDVDELHTDGGYSSEDVDEAMAEMKVDQVQTAIKGAKPDPDTLRLEDFEWEISDQGKPESVTCPNGVQAQVIAGRSRDRCLAYFSLEDCEGCPFAADCPAKPLKRRPKRALRFSTQQQHVARRRQLSAQARENGQNLRAAVESTVRSVKHPFRNGKVPVRGQPRVSMMMIASAAMTNVRRICRYLQDKNKPENGKKSRKSPADNLVFQFFTRTSYFFSAFPPFSTYRAAEAVFAN
jgi:hypothetical protein